MTRPFGVKGKKRKHFQSKQDPEEEEHQQPPPKKAVAEESKEPSPQPEAEPEPEAAQTEEDELSGIPIAPSEKDSAKPNVIFILERASLEVAKVGKVLLPTLLCLTLFFFSLSPFVSIHSSVFVALQTYQLLNSDDHANFLRKNNKNPGDYRPDITHQVKPPL